MGHIRLWGLIVLVGLNSCTKKEITGEIYNSPSGQYILKVEIGDEENPENKYEIRFRLLDKDGEELDVTGTKASAVMNYAVFWNSDNTITLYSSDIGVYAWRVTPEDKLTPAPVDYKLTKKAEEIFKKKMGR